MACTDWGYSMGTDHGAQDRRDENLRAQLNTSTGRPPTGGAADAVPPLIAQSRRRSGLGPWRRTALLIGATSEPRDVRQNQNPPGGGADGVGDEYATSGAANPKADQSAHR
jgi:hypothetical protein